MPLSRVAARFSFTRPGALVSAPTQKYTRLPIEAGAIARTAKVDKLVLVHLNPLLPCDGLEVAARTEFDDTIVGSDLLALDVA